MKEISVIFASRERPLIAFETYTKWFRAAKDNDRIEYIVGIDSDDTSINQYLNLFGSLTIIEKTVPIVGAVQAYNMLVKRATGRIYVVLSDDFDPCPNWDEQILEATKDKHCFTLQVNDGHSMDIATFPIMDREFSDKYLNGLLFSPEYIHFYADTELTQIGKRTGCQIVRPDILFKHNHFSFTGQPLDAIGKEIRNNGRTSRHDRIVYERHLACGFGLGAV